MTNYFFIIYLAFEREPFSQCLDISEFFLSVTLSLLEERYIHTLDLADSFLVLSQPQPSDKCVPFDTGICKHMYLIHTLHFI